MSEITNVCRSKLENALSKCFMNKTYNNFTFKFIRLMLLFHS